MNVYSLLIMNVSPELTVYTSSVFPLMVCIYVQSTELPDLRGNRQNPLSMEYRKDYARYASLYLSNNCLDKKLSKKNIYICKTKKRDDKKL